jgi:hypothetical protein
MIAEEAGPVEHSSAEAKSLKLEALGTVWFPPQWATTEAARRGGQMPNKGLLSRYLRKNTELNPLTPVLVIFPQSTLKNCQELEYAPIGAKFPLKIA